MNFDFCPRCDSNNFSCLQIGNHKNLFFYYAKTCQYCLNFSYKYICSAASVDLCCPKIYSYQIIVSDFVIQIESTNEDENFNKTTIYSFKNKGKIMEIDSALKMDIFIPDDQLVEKIRKILVFS